MLGFLVNSLNQEEPEVLATAIVGISKLMLSGMITDEDVGCCFRHPHSARADPPFEPPGPQAPRTRVLCDRDGRQPRTSPVPVVLPPRLLLLEPPEPAPTRQRPSPPPYFAWPITDALDPIQIFLRSLTLLKSVHDDLEDKAGMVTPLQIGLQLIDWTDPQKAMYATRFIPSYLLHLLTLPVYSQSDSVSPDESIQIGKAHV